MFRIAQTKMKNLNVTWFKDQCVVFLVLCFVTSMLPSVKCFNIDLENFFIYREESNSMFGFSVAQYIDRGFPWVIVGAPEARTPQGGVENGGAVYKCRADSNNSCQQVGFDLQGNNRDNQQRVLDEKSKQWFGATVQSSGPDGVIVACAPRYVWFTTGLNRRDPVGTCWVARQSFADIAEYSPCRTHAWGYHRQGSCQAGLGAGISGDGQRLFIGAVGSWYWQGQLYSQNLSRRPDLLSTREGSPADDDSYLGYSVAVGNFAGYEKNDVAVGMPRGESLVGRVVMYTSNLTNIKNLTGDQMGAYFSYAMCAADVDGDKLDDLIVGAPLYTNQKSNDGSYETGRIYIYYQGKGNYFEKPKTIDGVNSKSRFGLALSRLGDINLDGFEDIAVGAPYGGQNGRGAVFIFQGSSSGIMEKHSQVIFAEEIAGGLRTFGFSLSGGLDLDKNQYPDLVVGAYEANTAVLLRSRPVISMIAKLEFAEKSKSIDLKRQTCYLRDGTSVSCIKLNSCFEYSGLGVDNVIDLEVQYVLDAKKTKNPRMFFMEQEGRNSINRTIRINKNALFCKDSMVYVKPGIRDKLSSMEAEIRYSLREAGRRRRSLPPVLDVTIPHVEKDTLSIQKNCGQDNVCIPDLQMAVEPGVKRFLMGSKTFSINVTVQNEGEDAFEAMYYLKLPEGMNYSKVENLVKDRERHVLCSAPTPETNNTLVCDIGNPLPQNKLVHFRVLLHPFYVEGEKSQLDFQISVNSTNPERPRDARDNIQQLSVPVYVKSDITVVGSSFPPELHYNASQYNYVDATQESQYGPHVTHVYEIKSTGVSHVLEVEAIILWPTYTLDGDSFLYLLEQPHVLGPIRCQPAKHVNELNLELDKRRKGAYSSERFNENSRGASEISSEDENFENEETFVEEYGNGHSRTTYTRTHKKTTTVHTQTVTSSNQSRSSGSQHLRKYNSFEPSSDKYEDVHDQNHIRNTRDIDAEWRKAQRCETVQCTKIYCKAGPFTDRDSQASIELRARVSAETLKKLGLPDIRLSSAMVTRVTLLPFKVNPNFIGIKDSEAITSVHLVEEVHRKEVVPLWVVLLSACAGAIILLLLAFLLWKCGFFKRNRPDTSPEKEPLHRNGHFQPGDEAL